MGLEELLYYIGTCPQSDIEKELLSEGNCSYSGAGIYYSK